MKQVSKIPFAVSAFLLIFSLWTFLVPLSVKAEVLYDGLWSGTTDQGHSISFTIADGNLTKISIKTTTSGAICTATQETTSTINQGEEISNGAFSYTQGVISSQTNPLFPSSYSDGLSITGSFSSTSEIVGTWKQQSSQCNGTALGTWVATKNSSSFTYYLDGDNDGFGTPEVAIESSSSTLPQGYAANNTDCNDSDPDIHPGATEICGDSIDQDCNGSDKSCVTFTQVAELYVATFNRAPDAAGLNYWVESGFTIEQIARSFFDQSETQALYPAGTSDADFVTSIYQNLFNRNPDTAGLAFWIGPDGLGGGMHRSVMIEALKNGALGSDRTIIDNKTEVGLYYANQGLEGSDFSLSDVTEDSTTIEASKRAVDELNGSFTIPKADIVIDGDFSDWENVPVAIIDNSGDVYGAAIDLLKGYVALGSDALYFMVETDTDLSSFSAPNYGASFVFRSNNSEIGREFSYINYLQYVNVWVTNIDSSVPGGGFQLMNYPDSYGKNSGSRVEFKVLLTDIDSDLSNMNMQIRLKDTLNEGDDWSQKIENVISGITN